jgi:hypothetical protein
VNRKKYTHKHQVVAAWQSLMPESSKPSRMEVLEETSGERIVIRLIGVGIGGANVIVKRTQPSTTFIESTIYEKVLPFLPVPRLHYYGSAIDQDSEYSWIFLEDVSGENYNPQLIEHRIAAANWIGTMNTSVLNNVAAKKLPNRQPDHYLELLHRGVNLFLLNDSNPALKLTDLRVIEKILGNCEFLKINWDQITNICKEMPSTLVHGDFISKNVAVRNTQNGLSILPFDWEKAGWGCPSEDISRIDIPTYQAITQDYWPGIDSTTLMDIANVGKIFRCLVYIDWIAPQLGEKEIKSPMDHLKLCETWLSELIQTIL